MNKRNNLLFALLSLSLAFSAIAGIYRVVDEDGKVTYTDNPPSNDPTTEKILIPTTNTQPALKTIPTVKTVQEEIEGYQEIAILTPTHDMTIPPGHETLTVQVGLNPALKRGHFVQLIFDGNPLGSPTAATSFNIDSLIRGEHSVQIQIVDSEQKIIGTSNTNTIHVKRGSIQ